MKSSLCEDCGWVCEAHPDRPIAVVEDEAERVRLIYRRYLELSGVNELVRDLRNKDIRTKIRLRATGATHGGIPFERGSLFYLLRNRFYIGEIKYKGEMLSGEQPSIMDRQLFDAVQQKITDQLSHRNHAKTKSDHLLTGHVRAAVEGRLLRGIGVERLRDAPAEWSRQFEALGLNQQ